jgi:predicted cupin superfamily sugar epimerase
MAKPWRCRIGRHRWQRLRNPEGGWYRECRRCQKQQDLEDTPKVFPSP